MRSIDFSKSDLGILFVCLGNICRSPLAAALFREQALTVGIKDRFHIDSCGTGGWHAGENAHRQTVAVAKQFGISLADHRARQIRESDLRDFDLIVAMDRSNLRNITKISKEVSAELVLLREFDPLPESKDVPDPWGCDQEEFINVHRIIERSCAGLIEWLVTGADRGIGTRRR